MPLPISEYNSPQSQLFVHNYDPLRIFRVAYGSSSSTSTTTTPTTTIAGNVGADGVAVISPRLEDVPCIQSKLLASVWKYGHIRGGTPLLRYNSSHALSLFHSSMQLDPTDPRRSYFMGFLLLDITLPMRVAAISRVPLIGQGWYSGYLVSDTFYYANYPLGIALADGGTVVISYGRQDLDGYVSTVQLSTVIAGLVTV